MTGNTKLLDQTERRQQLRVIEEDFGENLFVKQVETPGPKPNEIGQEHGESDRDYGDDRPNPF